MCYVGKDLRNRAAEKCTQKGQFFLETSENSSAGINLRRAKYSHTPP